MQPQTNTTFNTALKEEGNHQYKCLYDHGHNDKTKSFEGANTNT